ncbi:hypothetical protein AA313_de0210327 [Arthrobotrys entomopaga]|nr:hypothetical protein AA313_de0210327 [Arthrobotrys entomopaga]
MIIKLVICGNLQKHGGNTDKTEDKTASNLEGGSSTGLRWSWWDTGGDGGNSGRAWDVDRAAGAVASWGGVCWGNVGRDDGRGSGEGDEGGDLRLGSVGHDLDAGGCLLSRGGSRGGGSHFCRGGLCGVVGVGDTELWGVLELTVGVNDELETVMGGIGLERILGGPEERAGVFNLFSDGVQWLDVSGRTTEQDDADGSLLGWAPGDLVRLADRDKSSKTWSVDGVGGDVEGRWGGVCHGRGRDGEEGGEDFGEHFQDVLMC